MDKLIRNFKRKAVTVNILYLILYALCTISYIIFRNDPFIILITWIINTVAAIGNWCWYFYCKRKFKKFDEMVFNRYCISKGIF